jgi:dsRNA-specific ribonuclease
MVYPRLRTFAVADSSSGRKWRRLSSVSARQRACEWEGAVAVGCPPARAGALARLQMRIRYQFRNPKLLDAAMTTRAWLTTSAQRRRRPVQREHTRGRLEYLGDRVLGLVATVWLMKAHPHAQAGELTSRCSDLVSNLALSHVAQRLQLHGHGALRVIAPAASAPRPCTSPISGRHMGADTLEAIIGAVYLDSNMDAAADFVHQHLRLSEPVVRGTGSHGPHHRDRDDGGDEDGGEAPSLPLPGGTPPTGGEEARAPLPDQLHARLGYSFRDRSLLEVALSRRPAALRRSRLDAVPPPGSSLLTEMFTG